MRRPRLTYANVTSSLALFLALGGTGYAVSQLPRNSVGNRQLKANAVTAGKIRAGAVQRSDLAASARGGSRGPRGEVGPAGPQGEPGPSTAVQDKNAQSINLSAAAGGAATPVTVTLEAGSWDIEAQTTAFYSPPAPGSEFIDCALQTGAGDALASGVVRVGTDAAGTEAGVITVQGATDLAATTSVGFTCAHPSTIAAEPHVERSVLIARRVGRVDNR